VDCSTRDEQQDSLPRVRPRQNVGETSQVGCKFVHLVNLIRALFLCPSKDVPMMQQLEQYTGNLHIVTLWDSFHSADVPQADVPQPYVLCC